MQYLIMHAICKKKQTTPSTDSMSPLIQLARNKPEQAEEGKNDYQYKKAAYLLVGR